MTSLTREGRVPQPTDAGFQGKTLMAHPRGRHWHVTGCRMTGPVEGDAPYVPVTPAQIKARGLWACPCAWKESYRTAPS